MTVRTATGRNADGPSAGTAPADPHRRAAGVSS